MSQNLLTDADNLLIDQKVEAIARTALNLTMIRSIIEGHVACYRSSSEKRKLIREQIVTKFLRLLEKELGDA